MFGNLHCQIQHVQDVNRSIKTLLGVLANSSGYKPCWALSRIGNTAMRETSWSVAPNSKVTVEHPGFSLTLVKRKCHSSESLLRNWKPCCWKEQVRYLMVGKFSYRTQNLLRLKRAQWFFLINLHLEEEEIGG